MKYYITRAGQAEREVTEEEWLAASLECFGFKPPFDFDCFVCDAVSGRRTGNVENKQKASAGDIIKETEIILYKANLYNKQYELWAGKLVDVTQCLVVKAKEMKEQLKKVETACIEECLYRNTEEGDECDCPACLVWDTVKR